MLLGRYQFTCRFREDALLPPYKGSTFRGAFGSALKKVVCAVREKDCARCLLAGRCVYARIFETTPLHQEQGARIVAPPHPYVIEPPMNAHTRYCSGDTFSFVLHLFGEYTEYLPYFVYAFEAMGEQGLGSRRGQGMGRYVLEAVSFDSQPIYDATKRQLSSIKPHSLILPPPKTATGTVTLSLITPLRIKYENHLQAALPFHLLIRSTLRRISSLYSFYGNGEPDLDYRGLIAGANEVKTVSSELRWCDWERYSNRQEQTMLMGGMLGHISYYGELGEYLPLLNLARDLHLGKQSAFGLGKIDYTFDEGPAQ